MTNETRKMSIAKALKEKERIATKLEQARKLVARYNSVRSGVACPVSVKDQYALVMELEAKYLEIRKAIAIANGPVMDKLAEMLVLRGSIAYRDTINTTVAAPGYERNEIIAFNVTLSEMDVLAAKEELQNRLDALQDELDAYNATHTVEVPA